MQDRMECETNDIHDAKGLAEEDIKNRLEISQDEHSHLKKKLKNKNKHKVKHKDIDKDVWKKTKLLQNQDSCLMEVQENETDYKVKYKDKHIVKRIKMSENKDTDSMKESENNDIGNEMKTSQNKTSDLKKIWKNKYSHENRSEENVKEKYCSEEGHGVKYKDEDIQKKTSQDENSDSLKKSKNESMCKKIHKVKFKDEDRNWINMSRDKDNDSLKKLENINIHKIENGIETLQNEDSDLESKDARKVKYKDEDIRNRIKTLRYKNSDPKKMWKNKYTYWLQNDSGDEGVEEEYCSDATYLARQLTSRERLRQAEASTLYNLKVQLRHTVLPQHEIETRAGSHIPTRNEMEKFEKIIPIRKGSYSFKEDNIIVNNWKAFCKLHNWNVESIKPFLQLRIGTKFSYMRTTERRKFVQFLADGLPDRTLYSVYHRFKNVYEDNLQRRFKPEEDEMIMDHLENNPSLNEKHKYVDLAKALRRTRHSIWRRYQILKKKKRKLLDII